MRPTDGHKNNGMTSTNISSLNSRFFSADNNPTLTNIFCFFLPPHFFGFYKPALANTNLAHLLLPSEQAYAPAKSKELNYNRTKIRCPP